MTYTYITHELGRMIYKAYPKIIASLIEQQIFIAKSAIKDHDFTVSDNAKIKIINICDSAISDRIIIGNSLLSEIMEELRLFQSLNE